MLKRLILNSYQAVGCLLIGCRTAFALSLDISFGYLIMARMNNDPKKEQGCEGLANFIFLMIALIDSVVSGGIAFVIFVKYIFQRFPEGSVIALLLHVHIWLIIWFFVFLVLFLFTGGVFWYFFCWRKSKK